METNIYGGTLEVQQVRFHTSPAVDTCSNPYYGTNLTCYSVVKKIKLNNVYIYIYVCVCVYTHTMYVHIYMCLTESLCCKEDIHTML